MKKFIITAIIVTIVALAAIMLRGMLIISKIDEQPASYKYIENLNGIGCLKIGMTTSAAKKALDSMYVCYQKSVWTNVKRNEVFKLDEPSYEAPTKYHPKHKEYKAALILGEDFIPKDIELYFWEDTLYRIHAPNYSHSKAKDIGEGLILKYGEGFGHNKQDGIYEDKHYKWGNDRCLVTYEGRTIASSEGPRWFYDVEVITQDSSLPTQIKAYLHSADSLWQAEKNAAKYKNL